MVKMTEAEFRAEALRKHEQYSTVEVLVTGSREKAIDRLVERAKRLGLIEG